MLNLDQIKSRNQSRYMVNDTSSRLKYMEGLWNLYSCK